MIVTIKHRQYEVEGKRRDEITVSPDKGWRSIDFFYGDTDYEEFNDANGAFYAIMEGMDRAKKIVKDIDGFKIYSDYLYLFNLPLEDLDKEIGEAVDDEK